MTTTTSRRAILAGAASLPALAIPAAAVTAPPDPILALIEAHKAAFRIRLQKLAIHFADEEDKGAEAASNKAMDASVSAAMSLVDTTPTTIAGVVALIAYVDSFNRGAFKVEDMQSSVSEWPGGNLVDEKIYEASGESGELGFAFAVLLNVGDALAALAVS